MAAFEFRHSQCRHQRPNTFNPNGYVVSAFQGSWSSISHNTPGPDNYLDGVIRAVRIANDTDSPVHLPRPSGLTFQESVIAACHPVEMSYSSPSVASIEGVSRLLSTDSWRRRVVEKIVPISHNHYALRRSFQFDSPFPILDSLEPINPGRQPQEFDDLLLPVCWLDKEPLHQFDVFGPNGQSLAVVDRETNSYIVALVLDSWQAASGISDDERLDVDTVLAICRSSLDPWNDAYASSDGDPINALDRYYESLLGFRINPVRCQSLVAEIPTAILTTLEEGAGGKADAFNSLLNPAILAPWVAETESAEDLIALVRRVGEDIDVALAAAKIADGLDDWRRLLTRAATQWPVLVRMPRGADQPFIVKTTELRPSGAKSARRFVHYADIGAALSYHIEVAAPEPAVRLGRPPAFSTLGGLTLGAPGMFDSARYTNELFTAYSSRIDRPERPDRARVDIQYAVYLTTYAPDLFALVLTLIALAVALFFHANVDAVFAAVLLIPTTVVSGFIATRESVLVASFMRRLRLSLPILNIVLWVVVLLLVGLSSGEGT